MESAKIWKKSSSCLVWFKGNNFFNKLFHPGEAVTAQFYSEYWVCLNDSLKKKGIFPGQWNEVILLHAKTHPLVTNIMESIEIIMEEIAQYVAYSQDLSSLDNHLFYTIQHSLSLFSSCKELKIMKKFLKEFTESKMELFFYNGI